jgi:hypothetical protein
MEDDDNELDITPRVGVWEERDRLHISVTGPNDHTIAEWWDDDASQMFEDGFFKSGGRSIGRLSESDSVFTESVLNYCRYIGLLPEFTFLWYISPRERFTGIGRDSQDALSRLDGRKRARVPFAEFCIKLTADRSDVAHVPIDAPYSELLRIKRIQSGR